MLHSRRMSCAQFLVPILLVCTAAHADVPATSSEVAAAAEPLGTFEAYRTLLERGATPADESIFTPESRVQRARHAPTRTQETTRLAELEAASPLRPVVSGDRAVLLPAATDSKTAPVLLRRVDGLWRIDLVELAKNHLRDDKGELLFNSSEDPYAFAYPGNRSFWEQDLSPVDLHGEDVGLVLARIEKAEGARMRLRLAEILLRNLGLVDEAIEHYEEAARLAPADLNIVVIMFGNRAALLNVPDRAIPLLEPFGTRAYAVLSRLHARAGRFEEGQHFARADLAERMKGWKAQREALEAEKKRQEQERVPAAQSL